GVWLGGVLQGLLPERKNEAAPALPESKKRLLIPIRLIIAAGVVILLGLLTFSMVSLSGSSKKAATNSFLSQAQQEDLLANQPALSPTDRQQHLQNALDKARQALVADPHSSEASLLVRKTQSALDALLSITHLEPKLLFD